MMDTIQTLHAPKAIGPYSQATRANGFIFCSGQIALDPVSGELQGSTTQEQTQQVLQNLKAVLEEAGSSLEKVTQTTCYMKNIADFAEFNEVYARFFTEHKPARVTVEVSDLPKNALVEVSLIATT